MSRGSSSVVGIAAGLALLLGAPSALALSYTIPAPVLMDSGSGEVMTIVPVFDDSGADSCLAGDCGGADRLVFDVSVSDPGFEELLVAVFVIAPQGVGYYTDGETIPSGGAIVGGGGRFDFDAPNLTGESNRLFLSYASLAGGLGTQFSATPIGEVIFSETGGITPIPEPSTLALCTLGLVALAARKRRGRI